MSNVATLPVPQRTPDAEPRGQILLSTRVARGALLIWGWHSARLPRSGTAGLDHELAARGPFRLIAWARGGGEAWFLAALQLPPEVRSAGGRLLTLQANGHAERPLAQLPQDHAAPSVFARSLAGHAKPAAGAIAMMLADLAIQAPRAEPLRAVLQSFLREAAETDGVIEMAGGNAGTLLLQGWGRPETDPETEVLIADGTVLRRRLHEARFIRPDIAAPATGLVALVPDTGDLQPGSVTALHLVSGGRLVRRDVLPGRTVLGPAETAAHLRDMRARLVLGREVAALATAAQRPQFDGRNTVESLDAPVRAAIDLAVGFEGTGILLTGWLLDPEARVQRASLRGTAGFVAALPAGPVRIARPDILGGFRVDPRFAALSDDEDRYGFAAFLSAEHLPRGGEALWLELELEAGIAHLPLRLASGAVTALRRRALESLDLHKPSAVEVITQVLGPLFSGLCRAPVRHDAETIRSSRSNAPRALLLPLPATMEPPHTALAPFLADPLSPEERLVLVAPSIWGGREIARLLAALALYRIEAQVLQAGMPLEWTEALDLAAAAAGPWERIHCLGAGLSGPHPGWRGTVAAALQGGGPALAFPTVLYEDDAIRTIGLAGIEALDTAPWSRPLRPCAGLPAACLRGGKLRRAPERLAPTMGALQGAVLTRASWEGAGGFGTGAILASTQEAAWLMRHAAAGGQAHHVGSVAVHAVDAEPTDRAAPWRKVAALVDGWLVAKDWAGRGGAGRGGAPSQQEERS